MATMSAMAVVMVMVMTVAAVIPAATSEIRAVVVDDAAGDGKQQRAEQAEAGDLTQHGRDSSVVHAGFTPRHGRQSLNAG